MDLVICEVCSKQFNNNIQLRHHRKVHSEIRYSCDECSKIFKTKDGLGRHKLFHTGEKPYTCLVCGKSFADPGSCKNHEKYQHPHVELNIACEICSKKFKRERTLKLHMVVHEREKQEFTIDFKLEALKCVDKIGVSETSNKLKIPYTTLRNWVVASKAEYFCQYCGKELSSKHRLKEHERSMHEVAKEQYRQPKFSKTFREEVIEYISNNTVLGACSKFDLAESTVRNIWKAYKNPFSCGLCKRICSYRAQLERHLKEVHMKDSTQITETKLALREYIDKRNLDLEIDFSENAGVDIDTFETIDEEQIKQTVSKTNISIHTEALVNTLPIDKKLEEEMQAQELLDQTQINEDQLEHAQANIELTNECPLAEKSNTVIKETEDAHEQYKVNLKLNDEAQITEEIVAAMQETKDIYTSEDIHDETCGDNEQSKSITEEITAEMKENVATHVSEENFDKIQVNVKMMKESKLKLANINVKDEMSEMVDEFYASQDIKLKVTELQSLNADSEIMKETKQTEELLAEINDNTGETKCLGKILEEMENISHDAEQSADQNIQNEFEVIMKKMQQMNNAEISNFIKLLKSEGVSFDVGLLDKFNYSSAYGIANDKFYPVQDVFELSNEKVDPPKNQVDQEKFEINEDAEVLNISSEVVFDENLMKPNKIKKVFNCEECTKTFKTLSDIKRHMIVHSGVKAFKCTKCVSAFTLKHNLERHVTCCHDEQFEGFPCSICPKTFSQKHTAKEHERTHTGEKPFKCNICTITFPYNINLMRHIEAKHEGKVAVKYTCEHCGKQFKRSNEFNFHCKTHIEGKPICDICGASFTRRSAAYRHRKLHQIKSGTKFPEYTCEVCGKVFSTDINQKRHMISHTGQKDFQCNQCEKAYKDKRQLTNHEAIVHEGKKDHVCNKCNKCFTRYTSLKAHMLLHEGKSIFQCEVCPVHS